MFNVSLVPEPYFQGFLPRENFEWIKTFDAPKILRLLYPSYDRILVNR
jgi:hypothetical protein